MLEYICDSSKSHSKVNSRETRYKIRDCIKLRQTEWRGELLSTRNMVKDLQKVFKAVVNDNLQVSPILGESGSEVSYFIPEPRNFSEVTRFSDNIKKTYLKAALKEIKNLIKNHNFLVQDPWKGEPVTPCMGVYKAKTQSYGSLDKLNLRIVVRGDLKNKELVGNTWSPTASMRTLRQFLADAVKQKEIVHQLYFIGEFLQEKVKNRVFVKLESRYADYFQNTQITLEGT